MPFIYAVDGGVQYTTAGASTVDVHIALRESTRGFKLTAFYAQGKGAGLTALSGIMHRVRRWTTVGSGGDSLVASPRAIGTTASTTCVHDNGTNIVEGTVSGAYQLSVGHGATGPGGWVARDDASKVLVEPGSGDELAFNDISGTASLTFEAMCEIEE